jgi:hypothetical protein
VRGRCLSLEDPCGPRPAESQDRIDRLSNMAEEAVDSHVQRKYEIVQKLGKGVSLSGRGSLMQPVRQSLPGLVAPTSCL